MRSGGGPITKTGNRRGAVLGRMMVGVLLELLKHSPGGWGKEGSLEKEVAPQQWRFVRDSPGRGRQFAA